MQFIINVIFEMLVIFAVVGWIALAMAPAIVTFLRYLNTGDVASLFVCILYTLFVSAVAALAVKRVRG